MSFKEWGVQTPGGGGGVPAHAPTHSDGGSDPITVENLATAAVNTSFALKPDGAGGLVFGTVTASATVPTGNTVWVDAVNGSDATGTSGRQDLPFLTIQAACAAASAGDCVKVRSGTYTENFFAVPADVKLVGDGWKTTKIVGANPLLTTLALNSGSQIEQFTVSVPTAAGKYGIEGVAGAGTTSSVFFCSFEGGAGGLGYGVAQTGLGKIISLELRWIGGDATSMCYVPPTGGVIATQANHIPPGSGNLAAGWICDGGRFQGIDLNCGSPTVTDGIRTGGGKVRCFVLNFFNTTNALHLTSNDVNVEIQGGAWEDTPIAVLVDPALTLANAEVKITIDHQPVYSFPPAASQSDFAVIGLQQSDDRIDQGYNLFGAPINIGFPEKGSELRVGEGPPYVTGQVVLTTDGTAGPASDGGNFVDESVAAASKASSTFTLQGLTAGHSVLFGSQRKDSSGNPLFHYGLRIFQEVGAVGGAFVFEIWDGAAWTEVKAMSTSQNEGYRYADSHLLRGPSREDIRYNIGDTTAWANKTINGQDAYWSRIRITSVVTTLPVFQQTKLHTSASVFSDRGFYTAIGLAQFKEIIFAGGNVFGETGNVTSSNLNVGTGGVPTGWAHNSPNSLLDGNGDAVYTQFVIPDKTCTAYPLSLQVKLTLDAAGASVAFPEGIMSMIPLQTAGSLIADPAGGTAPIVRTLANTETLTAKAAQSVTHNLQPAGSSIGDDLSQKVFVIDFGPFDISSYYPGDVLAVRFELNDDGNPNYNVTLWALAVEGVNFATGKPLQ